MTDSIKTAKTNGVDTAYRFDGPEGGRVVLMSNSLMSNHQMWDWTIPALTDGSNRDPSGTTAPNKDAPDRYVSRAGFVTSGGSVARAASGATADTRFGSAQSVA